MAEHNTPPAWITDYAISLRDLLGLSEWRIWVQMTDNPGGEGGHDGSTHLDTRYLKATISLCRDWGGDDAKMRRIIAHEHWHIALSYLDQATDRICDLVPEHLRKHVANIYSDAEEATIERLVRSMEAHIKPPEDAHAADA